MKCNEYVYRKRKLMLQENQILPNLTQENMASYLFPSAWYNDPQIFLDSKLAEQTGNAILLFVNVNACRNGEWNLQRLVK